MRLTRWNRRRCVLAVTGLAAAALAVPGLPAPGAAGAAWPAGPQLRLIAAPRSITLDPSGGPVRRPLPASGINGFNYGLTKFLTLTARNSAGKAAAAETIPFCPDTY